MCSYPWNPASATQIWAPGGIKDSASHSHCVKERHLQERLEDRQQRSWRWRCKMRLRFEHEDTGSVQVLGQLPMWLQASTAISLGLSNEKNSTTPSAPPLSMVITSGNCFAGEGVKHGVHDDPKHSRIWTVTISNLQWLFHSVSKNYLKVPTM